MNSTFSYLVPISALLPEVQRLVPIRITARRAATAAKNRRGFYENRLGKAATFRALLAELLDWVRAEGHAAPPVEQEGLLTDLQTIAKDMNDRRQQ